MLFNSSTIAAPFLLHRCLKAKTLVKREMLVVSEQLQYLDLMTVRWLRVGKAGEKVTVPVYSSRRGNSVMGSHCCTLAFRCYVRKG